MSSHPISFTLNGAATALEVEPRWTLLDVLRRQCGTTGVHAGCEHGVCGACTIIVDDVAVRACLMLAPQADGCEIRTVESVAEPDGTLHRVQRAMREEFSLQCGFCTPGVVMTLVQMDEAGADEDAVVEALTGHLCRCTGYQGMKRVARRLGQATGAEDRQDG
ncbi:(2Fe-2S)-binding protein [Novosphingobium endophyticum]|uniref:(2Fe-2S)-binding protein n=1 Tax=Novosphingobium endophyticum TaxID=1955250 RepID=A0A916TVM9_9SPHN|nr:(2Fe-2S)-binding protein [Novosphingobium endophyticum]GGC15856.1 (2Fe-2S)-binding protein [Novosphingobium endophyticum]